MPPSYPALHFAVSCREFFEETLIISGMKELSFGLIPIFRPTAAAVLSIDPPLRDFASNYPG
jgi:hypothetical protein